MEDSANGRRLVMTFDSAFATAVVYNPPHRQAISIEPYTCVPDPFSLAHRGIDSGLQVLAPGETFSAAITIAVEPLA
jgi:aldose 1-epimerase